MRQGDDESREKNTKGRGLGLYLAEHHTVCLLCDEMCEADVMSRLTFITKIWKRTDQNCTDQNIFIILQADLILIVALGDKEPHVGQVRIFSKQKLQEHV